MTSRIEVLTQRVNLNAVEFVSSYVVKGQVGDSTENNRTPSVRQTIRYLKNSFNFSNYLLGRDLEKVYQVLLDKKLFKKLRRNKNRTDAIDISEFNDVINRYVSKNSQLKSVLGREISSVVV